MKRKDLTERKIDKLLNNPGQLPGFLFEIRVAHGLTRMEAAADMGFSYPMLTRYEKGYFIHAIPEVDLKKLASYYSIEIEFLTNLHNEFLTHRELDWQLPGNYKKFTYEVCA